MTAVATDVAVVVIVVRVVEVLVEVMVWDKVVVEGLVVAVRVVLVEVREMVVVSGCSMQEQSVLAKEEALAWRRESRAGTDVVAEDATVDFETVLVVDLVGVALLSRRPVPEVMVVVTRVEAVFVTVSVSPTTVESVIVAVVEVTKTEVDVDVVPTITVVVVGIGATGKRDVQKLWAGAYAERGLKIS
jgi:hypothetical protein